MTTRGSKKIERRTASLFICKLLIQGLLVATACILAQAETAAGSRSVAPIDLLENRQMISPLDRDFRFHGGDDPRWSDPGFDDSAWKVLQPSQDWDEQGFAPLNQLA